MVRRAAFMREHVDDAADFLLQLGAADLLKLIGGFLRSTCAGLVLPFWFSRAHAVDDNFKRMTNTIS
jgi:hypothetical protein